MATEEHRLTNRHDDPRIESYRRWGPIYGAIAGARPRY